MREAVAANILAERLRQPVIDARRHVRIRNGIGAFHQVVNGQLFCRTAAEILLWILAPELLAEVVPQIASHEL
jgi:hypothetical protein